MSNALSVIAPFILKRKSLSATTGENILIWHIQNNMWPWDCSLGTVVPNHFLLSFSLKFKMLCYQVFPFKICINLIRPWKQACLAGEWSLCIFLHHESWWVCFYLDALKWFLVTLACFWPEDILSSCFSNCGTNVSFVMAEMPCYWNGSNV